MDDNTARIIIVGIMGLTISISMLGMAVARIVEGRRRRGLRDSTEARIEERLSRIEQAVDAIATEVERVSESQRFTSRLLADRATERQT